MEKYFVIAGIVRDDGKCYSNTYVVNELLHKDLVERIHDQGTNVCLCDRTSHYKDTITFQYVGTPEDLIPEKFQARLAKRMIDLIFTISQALT